MGIVFDMKLSIIVPVYNMASGNKLNFCLDSLVNQTLRTKSKSYADGSYDDIPYEIIAVDDCSTDNSLAILRGYEAKYPDFFQVVQTPENLHQGGAKNIGMSLARGEWIGFIDADDWVVPDFYERLLTKAKKTGADMVGCDYCLVDKHTFEPTKPEHNNSIEQTGILDEEKYKLLMLDCGSLVVKIYRREIVIDNPGRFPEHIFYEDNALCKSWMLRAKHFEYIDEPLYFYYQHNTSTVHTITVERMEDRMEAGRVMIAEAKRGGYFDQYKDELEYSFAVLFYMNTLMSYMQVIKPKNSEWIQKLGDEMKEYFPDFLSNKYFLERVHPEEQKWARMQQKNTRSFILYYSLKATYRNIRKIIGI